MKYIIFMSIICGIFSLPAEDQSLKEFTIGNHRFTSAIYNEIVKTERGNLIVSPLSTEIILALTNEGAAGDTSWELVTGLSLPKTEKTHRALESLQPVLRKNDEDVKLLSANKIFAANDLELKDSFKSVATTVYDADVANVDFSKSDAASDEINKWVEGKTNGKIKDLIKSEDVDAATRFVLVNAIYFNAKWNSKFDEKDTRKKKFFESRRTSVDIDTMHKHDYFNYHTDRRLGATFLELPYKGEDMSMVIVLPDEVDGLASLEERMEHVLEPRRFSAEEVNVAIPKFTIESEIQFIPILKKLGVKKLFAPGADLSGISPSTEPLYVNKVVQKAFINVTEAGTEAAAATAVIGVNHSLPRTYKFEADHPFLYLIKLKDIVVFIGRVVNPTG